MIWLVFWAIVFVVMLVVELATAGLSTCWFAAGALVAFVVALFLEELVLVQFIVFFTVSILLLVFTRPLLKKLLAVKTSPTNYDRCIGKIAVVEEKIDNISASGMVKIDGVEWTARSEDGSVIEKGTRVRIVKIEGVKVFVVKAEDKENK